VNQALLMWTVNLSSKGLLGILASQSCLVTQGIRMLTMHACRVSTRITTCGLCALDPLIPIEKISHLSIIPMNECQHDVGHNVMDS
jgi:hypothetical protein